MLVLLLACAASPDADSGASGPDPRVQVGTGSEAWAPLSPGDPVTMVHGPQGGWHMLGSLRTVDLDPVVDVRFTIRARAHGDALVSDGQYRVMTVPEPEDPDARSYPGMYGFLAVEDLATGEADTPPEILAWEPVLFRMEVVDAAGRVAADEVEVLAEPDPDDLDLLDPTPPPRPGGPP